MMNRKTLTLVVGLTSAAGMTAAPVLAQDMYKSEGASLYSGLNYTFVNLDTGSGDADVGTLSAKVGGLLTPFFGLEARGGVGVKDETIRGVDFSLDNFYGAYGTLNLANESPVTPYAILGFTRVELKAEYEGAVASASTSEDESGMSYGVGLNVDIAPNVAGNLEYMRYYDDDDVTIDGLGVGATFRF